MNQRKIAELAHVSVSTVSKALSGSKEINADTAKMIRKLAINMGYFKEKTKRKREYSDTNSIHISILVPEILGFHYSTIVTHLKNNIENKGGNAAVYIYDYDPNKCKHILESIIVNGKTDGVIMFSKPELAVEPNIPIVCYANYVNSNYDSISCDTDRMFNDSVSFFKSLGHKNIGYIGETYTSFSFNSFKKAIIDNGLQYNEDYIYKIKGRFEAVGVKAARTIISQEKRPTAIIATYDEVAHSLIYELSKNGVRVPDDISVMGINNIASSLYMDKPLTTINTYSEEQYKMAVDILFDKILNETKSVKHITIEHKIIERETTKRIGEDIK